MIRWECGSLRDLSDDRTIGKMVRPAQKTIEWMVP